MLSSLSRSKQPYTICMKYSLAIVLLGNTLAAQVLRPGMPAPPISAKALDIARPFPG
jgi:hypothetical protein